MPAVSGHFKWRDGLMWRVGFDASDFGPPNDFKFYTALVDTGASVTCISKEVVDDLGLLPVGKTVMQTASGREAANIYHVKLGFIISSNIEIDGTESGEVQIVTIPVVEFDPGENVYQALIGREILSAGVLNMSFDGHYSFSF